MMTGKDVQRILMHDLYFRQHIAINNNFSGAGLGECDVISLTKARFVYEYEIKVSRSDFKADFKKKFKHKVLSGELKDCPIYGGRWETIYQYQRPNFFYYAVPTGLIKPEEVPVYAGLIYCEYNNSFSGYKVQTIKNAPKLMKSKASDELIEALLKNLSSKNIFSGKVGISQKLIKEATK